MNMTMLDHALAYASRGWRVFPLVPREKRPITSHGLNDATTDEASIRGWWVKWPRANIGLACGLSGLVVVDIDPRNGKCEIDLEPTLCARTGGGGWHFYYSGNVKSGKLTPGVDIKSDGGYVVLPPSIHPSGKRYAWEMDLPIAPLPENIHAMLASKPTEHKPGPITPPTSRYAAAALRSECDAVAQAVEGTRNVTLYNAALKLATLGLPEGDITAALMAASPLPEHEKLATIKSGYKFGAAHPRMMPSHFEGCIMSGQPLVIGQQRNDSIPCVTFTGTWLPEWTERVKAARPEMVIVALVGRTGVELANHLNRNGVTAYLWKGAS